MMFNNRKLSIETLVEEIQPELLKIIELECQDESYERTLFGIFGPSSFRCKERGSVLDKK